MLVWFLVSLIGVLLLGWVIFVVALSLRSSSDDDDDDEEKQLGAVKCDATRSGEKLAGSDYDTDPEDDDIDTNDASMGVREKV